MHFVSLSHTSPPIPLNDLGMKHGMFAAYCSLDILYMLQSAKLTDLLEKTWPVFGVPFTSSIKQEYSTNIHLSEVHVCLGPGIFM